ncbi:MAG: outer membrane protein assembly factor BamD [Alphaproteobacteria bacterium]
MNFLILCILVSCSTNDKVESNYSSLDDVKLYNKAMSQLKKKEFDEAIEIFSELEIQYPYSPWASRGQLLTGFVHYTANEYDEAILSLSKFIELNPNHSMIPYAIYLKAYSYFERIPDINLDQKFSSRAFDEFSELINRYPNSKYAKKSAKHIKKLKNHLAAKEIKIGKFYQSQGKYLAAIKRYKVVLIEYQKSTLIPESIYRLIESYLSLGLVKQSYYLYKILEFNFPNSAWKREGLSLVKKYNLNKNLKKYKKKQLDLDKLKSADFDLI